MVARSVAPALAAGCTAVIKPAEQSPLSALVFAEICREVGFPAASSMSSPAMARRPARRSSRIRWCAASPSPARSRPGARSTPPRRGLKPVVLELGGKNPMIVLDGRRSRPRRLDALDGAFGNTGQVCSSSSRFLLHRSIRDAFLTGWRRARQAHRRPGPRRPGSRAARLRRAACQGLDLSRRRAAQRARTCVSAAAGPKGLDRGYFVAPTIFDRVDPAA